MNKLGSYKNGNYTVTIYDDGTKIRENDLDNLTPDTVESMDIKITNRCTGTNCQWCHEDSGPHGIHGDILSPSFLDSLHPYTELAIGGGNVLEHPDFDQFLQICKERNFIPSITVNQIHFEKEYDRITQLVNDKLIYGLGVSLVNPTDEFIKKIEKFSNAVIHVINGVVTPEQLRTLAYHNLKILILGYKEFRRGNNYIKTHNEQVDNLKNQLYTMLPIMLKKGWFKVISFDNISIKQLNVKRLLSKEDWTEFYMGDDGAYTMYVDMVNRVFAKNSCEPLDRRYPLMNTIEEMFNYLKQI